VRGYIEDLTAKEKRAILRAYRRGDRMDDIAAEFGLCWETIRKFARAHGLARRESKRMFSQKQCLAIRRAYESGKTLDEVRKTFGGSHLTIMRAIQRAGGKVRSHSEASVLNKSVREMLLRKFSAEEAANLREEYEAGASLTELGERYGVTGVTIGKAVRRAGGVIRKPVRRSLANEKKLEALRLWHAGRSLKNIARELRTDVKKVAVFLYQTNGLPRKNPNMPERFNPHRKYTLNEHAFDDAENNEDAQYFLGLLMADGCVSEAKDKKNGRIYKSIVLSLSNDDGFHLEDFKTFLGSNHRIIKIELPARRVLNQNKLSPAATVHRLQVSSARLVEAAERYGVVPRKSLTAQVHFLEDKPAFWRGAVCGDGCLGIDKSSGQAFLHLCGSKTICEQFLTFCNKHCSTKVSLVARGNIFYVRLGSLPAVTITAVLFPPDCIALKRKKELAEKILGKFANWLVVPPVHWLTPEDDYRIMCAHDAGDSVVELALEEGYEVSTIRKAIKRARLRLVVSA
jgi:uncharacterized protein YjcR